ncbi:TetR/AcrR family transcriptional regulator [Thermoplasma sp.]|uniref:TetR/AcrR family transcriptional regulator n=1 Tax=Thermoplasma sp. TaxID=1973142 RepID=UPI001276BF27|nr:TetR/AcrR family transcriptional regulator [Thermoplasma sp.]KAA8921935.1 MAG: TetR/AcrR family transcriptional regulator [Thermoplasma sp.]
MNKDGDKEEKILNAAIRVFSKKGYDSATIDEIASKAKVSKGIIFFYFKKKENLVERVALLSVPVKEITDVNKRDHRTAKDLIIDFGLSFLRKYESPELRNLLLMTMANKGRHKRIELALREMCFQEMDKMFSNLEALTGNKVPTPVRRAFFGSLLCYVVWWNDNNMDPEEYVDILAENILKLIGNAQDNVEIKK